MAAPLLYWRIPVGLTVGVGVALVMACGNNENDSGVDDNQFRSDVLDCESATAYLQKCCGASFDPAAVTCHHLYAEDPGCGSSRVVRDDPDLTEDESDCIRGESCDVIRANGICGRVTQRSTGLMSDAAAPIDGGKASSSASVCP